MINTNSCIGCKYLYIRGTGYSDWTWLESYVHCALDRNPLLLKRVNRSRYIEESLEASGVSNEVAEEVEEMLSEFSLPNIIKASKWLPIAGKRCSKYSFGPLVTVSPDDNIQIYGDSWDHQQSEAICKHADVHVPLTRKIQITNR